MKKWKKNKRSDLVMVAGLFIGIGIGYMADQLIGGFFLGLGLGFLGMVLIKK